MPNRDISAVVDDTTIEYDSGEETINVKAGVFAPADVETDLAAHVADTDNPHATSVANLGSGTVAELNAVISDADVATAAQLTAHTGNTSNPHSVTAAQVGAPTTADLTSHTGNTSNPHSVTAAQVGAPTTAAFTSHTGNTSNPHSVTAVQVGAVPSAEKAAALGVATLDSDGKIPASQLPALAIGETFIVASQAAMLALTAQRGDVAIRTDVNRTFRLSTDSPTTLADWFEILAPTGAVSSVAGRTGAVVLAAADISDSSSAGRALLTAANEAAQRTALSLVPGTDVQAYSAKTAAIAALTWAANTFAYFTGTATAAIATITSFGLSLVAVANAAAGRVLLELDNVTNAAQLTRAAADWAGFTSKSPLVGADVILVEDSAASGTKKRSTVAGIDHGTIAGLGDDDHTIYSLANGTRDFSAVVNGVTPTASAHLATKGYVDGVDTHLDAQNVMRSLMPFLGGTIGPVTSGRTFATYLGYCRKAKLIKYLEVNLSTVGVGTQTAEVALASSPTAPNSVGQTLTVLVADGTIDTLTTGTGPKKNTTAFSSGAGYTVPAGTHLWGLIRCAMGTTQPVFSAVAADMAQGFVLTADGVGALTGSPSPFSGSLVANTIATATAPLMSAKNG